ncbi:MAG: hypothetical protein J5699_02560 [Bacteroidales bacterium]|nr:hypothetical protein [Bacteroidales bacterium]
MAYSDTDYLDRFEAVLEAGLLKLSSGQGLTDGEMLQSDDIDAKWNDTLMKGYVGDAVENFNEYPEVAIAWAAYLGMGVAHDWDADFELFKARVYTDYYGPRGFDDLDEKVLALTGADEARSVKLRLALQSLAVAAQGLMHHEGIEADTERGFYVLVRIYTVLFRLGATIELKRLGYRYQ